MNSINNNTKVEMVVVDSLFQEIGWENPADANNIEWITLENIAANVHYYAHNDYSTAVRNTPEIRERLISFWNNRIQKEIDHPILDHYTKEDKERYIVWMRLMLEQIERQVAEGHSWILIRVAPEEEAAIRATLA